MGFFKSLGKKAKKYGKKAASAATSATKQLKNVGSALESATDMINDNTIASAVVDTAGSFVGVSNLSDKLETAGDVAKSATAYVDKAAQTVRDLAKKGVTAVNATVGVLPVDDSILKYLTVK